MILTREISIKISINNLNYFTDLGYETSIGETIIIPPELLSKGSHFKIKCKCDTCGMEKNIIYKNYLLYDNEKWGDYLCRKCSEPKRKKSLRESFGVDYPIQNDNVMNKMKKTLNNKKDKNNNQNG